MSRPRSNQDIQKDLRIIELEKERDELLAKLSQSNMEMIHLAKTISILAKERAEDPRFKSLELSPIVDRRPTLAREESPVPPAHWTPTRPMRSNSPRRDAVHRQLFDTRPFELPSRPHFPPPSPKPEDYDKSGRKRW